MSKFASQRNAILTILFFVAKGGASSIQFYDDVNFEGLFFKISNIPANECVNLPSYGLGVTSSVDVGTYCAILYEHENCEGRSVKLDGATTTNSSTSLGELDNSINSFQLCNTDVGGPEINIRMYKHDNLRELLVTYEHLCSCVNLPAYAISAGVSSLDNLGNCVIIYDNFGCEGSFVQVDAGMSSISLNLATVKFSDRMKSIRPCEPACLNVTAEIFKFEILLGSELEQAKSGTENIEMSLKSRFRNNGAATVVQQYSVNKSVTESITVSRSISSRTINSFGVSSSTEVEMEAGIPFLESVKITAALSTSYNSESESGVSEENSQTIEETREFSIVQEIQIPPCTEYQVSSYVTLMHNYPLQYVFWMRVTGEANGKKMNSTELRNQINDLIFVEVVNDYEIIAKEIGHIKYDFGVEAFVEGDGRPIKDCLQKQ